MNTQATTVKFASCPRTIVARNANGLLVNLGTYANYFLAKAVLDAAIAAGFAAEMLISLPA